MGKHAMKLAHRPDRGEGKQRGVTSLIVPIVLMLLSVAILLYPVVGTYLNNMNQQHAAARYAELEKELSPEQLSESFQAAQEYNATRAEGPLLDPWLARITEDNVQYQEYLQQLNLLDTMGRVVIPSISTDLPIYHGTSESVLQRGVGHLFGSDLPVGGEGTHAVLTGHTGLSDATLFDKLVDIKKGDGIYLQVAGQKLKYEVYDIEVVLPDQTDSLRPKPGEDLLTLVTCTPYGVNSHRLLVHAHRVAMDDDSVLDKNYHAWPWWMWAFVAAGVVFAAGMVWWLIRQLKKRDDDQGQEANSDAEL